MFEALLKIGETLALLMTQHLIESLLGMILIIGYAFIVLVKEVSR